MLPTCSRIAFILAFFLMATTTVVAHDGATGVVKERMDAMSALGSTMKSLLKIVKGRVEFDANKVQELTGQLSTHSGANLIKLFPKGSLDIPTAAAPKIWKDWDKFKTRAEELSLRAEEMAVISRDTSLQPDMRKDVLTKAYKRIARTCLDCHRVFRKKKHQ
jgi:cytochrome c556